MRDQVIQMMIFTQESKQVVDVNIKGQTTKVILPPGLEVKAIILDSNLVGYGEFCLDQKSADFLIFNLQSLAKVL